MRRETRYNLIFLGVVVALLFPGAVILFRKKMEPTIRPMYLPDAVPAAVAYLSPDPTPPGKNRVEPWRTAEWVRSVAREHAVAEVMRGADGLPVVSDRKTFQVVWASHRDKTIRVWIVEWRKNTGDWKLNGRATVSASETELAIPRLVREELGKHGVLVPPKEIVWRELDFSRVDGANAQRVALRLLRSNSREDRDEADFVLPFTSRADTAD